MGDGSSGDGKKPQFLGDAFGPTSPLFLHPSDTPSQVFVADLLTDMNYGEWSAEMSNALLAKNKLGFVLGTVEKPENGELLIAWMRCNAMVVGWLRQGMSREIRSSLSTSFTAKQIWDELLERFSTGNLPRRYKIRRQIMALRQDHSSVSTFYAKLKRLWDDWLMLDPPAKCTCGNCSCNVEQRTRESHEAMRLLDFLVGLDENYSTVRTHLLSLKPAPSLGEAYHAVANDEQQRNINNDQRPHVDAAAFQGQGERSSPDDRTGDGRPRCSHCGKLGHYRETCYDIIGWPPKSAEKSDRPRRRNQQQRKSRQDPQAAAVESSHLNVPGLSAEKVEQLKAFLQAGPPSSNTQPKANMSGLTLQEDDWDG